MAEDVKKETQAAGKNNAALSLIIMLMLAIILGAAHGYFFARKNGAANGAQAQADTLGKNQTGKDANNASTDKEGAKPASSDGQRLSYIKPLAPIVANLKDGDKIWIRLETSLIFSNPIEPKDEIVAKQITEDVLFYVRTLDLKDIEGPVALLFLSQELNERAIARSEGRVRQLIMESFVVQ